MFLGDSGISHVCKYQCPECTYYTAKVKHIKSHIEHFHEEKLTQKDHVCSFKGCSKPQEIVQPKNQDVYSFQCDQCPYFDLNEDLLKSHKKMVHEAKSNDLSKQLYKAIDISTIDRRIMKSLVSYEHVAKNVVLKQMVTKDVLNEYTQNDTVLKDSNSVNHQIKSELSSHNILESIRFQYDCELC